VALFYQHIASIMAMKSAAFNLGAVVLLSARKRKTSVSKKATCQALVDEFDVQTKCPISQIGIHIIKQKLCYSMI
jgi:hypothetical protein